MGKQNNNMANSYWWEWGAPEVDVSAEHTGWSKAVYLDLAFILNVTELVNLTWEQMEWLVPQKAPTPTTTSSNITTRTTWCI
jgi:hypothetical protein